jgi:hypothetical protein
MCGSRGCTGGNGWGSKGWASASDVADAHDAAEVCSAGRPRAAVPTWAVVSFVRLDGRMRPSLRGLWWAAAAETRQSALYERAGYN